MLVELKDIKKDYLIRGKQEKEVLKGVDLSVKAGELLAIMGKSGCGKSTLLNIMGGIAIPTEGEYIYQGERLNLKNQKEMDTFRKRELGFVVQDFALLKEKTALQNVMLPLRVRGVAKKEAMELAKVQLEKVGLGEQGDSYPDRMSGGEQQRVAIARALVCKPKILLADEPTGALDETNAEMILGLLKRIAGGGTAVVLVTHDRTVAEQCDRIVRIENGVLVEEHAK